ncbi:unnamed protein product [Psylliodes chrysocephalus]|uniref:Uncharacterized protein n=1 Tax=Psylliodes chrysocephalus TaxID=3402493 RepID=A0A9P0G9R4_9CUCU|nr:unnamed protein product [Psylliodes chrysocephala]
MRYIRNNINHFRLKLVPKLPKSISEINIFLNSVKITSAKGEAFLLINDIETNIVVFSCASNIEFMCKQDVLFVDGTLDYCTNFFCNFLPSMHTKMKCMFLLPSAC